MFNNLLKICKISLIILSIYINIKCFYKRNRYYNYLKLTGNFNIFVNTCHI